jgi:predicted transcriptional regulator
VRDYRRTRIEQLASILSYCAFHPRLKTHITQAANFNSQSVKPHIKYLVKKGLLETSTKRKHTYYSITERGFNVVKQWGTLQLLQKKTVLKGSST